MGWVEQINYKFVVNQLWFVTGIVRRLVIKATKGIKDTKVIKVTKVIKDTKDIKVVLLVTI